MTNLTYQTNMNMNGPSIASFLLAFLLSTCSTRVALALVSPGAVQVWDGVLSGPSSIQTLHSAATRSGLGHRVLDRSNPPQSVVECALDNILKELDDDSRYCEYWARQEWRHIEAHADVDELLARTEPALDYSFPQHGHVLYVQIGTDVQGPTCVFPQVSTGGELLVESDPANELVVVPAVTGRLLRFTGSALHSVPRPHNLWTLDFVQGAAQYTPEEAWGRSVVLFNTWPEGPPKDVERLTESQCSEEEFQADYCNQKSDWKPVPVHNLETTDETVRAKVWLLGDLKRRGHKMRTINLNAPVTIDEALGEKSAVQRLMLSPQI